MNGTEMSVIDLEFVKDNPHAKTKILMARKKWLEKQREQDKKELERMINATPEKKERLRAYHKAYCEKHKERLRAYHKAYYKAYCEKHKERLRAYKKAHNKAYYEKRKKAKT